MRQSILIERGILFQVLDYATTLNFTVWPIITDIISSNEGNIISGANFFIESRCVVDGVVVATRFADASTLICEGSLQGIWQVTNNYGFQKSEPFSALPCNLTVSGISPNLGLQQANNTSLFVYFKSNNFTNFQNSTFCDFNGINRTKLYL